MKKSVKYFVAIASIIGMGALAALADVPVEDKGRLSQSAGSRSLFEIKGSQNLNGAIKILPESGNEINIEYLKSARAGSEEQARRFLDLINLKLEPGDNDAMVLTIQTPSESPWEGSNHGVSLELFIQLPEKMKIKGDLHFMKLDISGPFPEVTIRSDFSPLNLEGINGPVDVSTTFAEIRLSDINGSVRAETRNAAIKASDIKVPMGSAIFQSNAGLIELRDIMGPVEVYTTYAPINVSDISSSDGSIVLRTTYSPIEVSTVSGELVCETSFSPINIEDVSLTHGHSKIETSYSPISAAFSGISESNLFISTSYGNISIEVPPTLSSQIVANVDAGGKIHTSDLAIKPTYLGSNRLEGTLNDGDSRIELKVGGVGQINIEGQ